MNKWIASWALVVLTFGCGDSADSRMPRIPIISLDKSEVQIGAFIAGAKDLPSAVFQVTNKGNADLEVKELILHCGCAEAEFADGPIKSGETRPLTVRVKEASRSGTLSANVSIVSNDPVRGISRARVGWELLAPFILDSEKIELRLNGGELLGAATLRHRGGLVPEVKLVACDVSGISAKSSCIGDELRLDLAGSAAKLPARGEAFVRLYFKNREIDALNLAAVWNLADELVATPSVIHLKEIRANRPAEVVIFLRLDTGKPFCVTKISSSNPAVTGTSMGDTRMRTVAKVKVCASPVAAGPLVADLTVAAKSDRMYARTIRIAGVVQ